MGRPIHTYPADTIRRVGAEVDRTHPRALRNFRLAYNIPVFVVLYGAIGWGLALLWSYAGPTLACIIAGALYGASTAWSYVTTEWAAERKTQIDEAFWLESAEGRDYERDLRDRMLEYR